MSATGPHFELVEIKQVTREAGLYGGIFRTVVVAQRISPDGAAILAQSAVLESRRSDGPEHRSRVEASLAEAHRKVLQILLSGGWEPIGTNADGQVVTLRKTTRKPKTPEPIRLHEDSGWLRFDDRWVYMPRMNRQGREPATTGSLGEWGTAPLPG